MHKQTNRNKVFVGDAMLQVTFQKNVKDQKIMFVNNVVSRDTSKSVVVPNKTKALTLCVVNLNGGEGEM